MGYFDTVSIKDDSDVVVDKVTIKNRAYQSKDFMYNGNGRYWKGDDLTITSDGYIYFSEKTLSDIKITGLVNIYSRDADYWLLIDRNKIIKAYRDMYYEELPREVKKNYGVYFGEDWRLDVDIGKLSIKTSRRLLKKRKMKRAQKYSNFSDCKKIKILKRKRRNKVLRLKHLTICVEKHPFLICFDEIGTYPEEDYMNKILSHTRSLPV